MCVLTSYALAGSILLYTAGIAKAVGASRVVYASSCRSLNSLVEKLGCEVVDLTLQSLNKIEGTVDVTVDPSGDPPGLSHLLRLTGRAGGCTSVVGVVYYASDMPFPVDDMYR
jgi:threonine dehydrogenase-like Zn-dependent dehydrogenase